MLRRCAPMLLACAACGPASLDTQLELKDATRKPDGVLVEPPPAVPSAEERGSTQAGVVALRQPIGSEQISEVVLKYIGAFVADDASAFSDLFESDAVMFGDNGRSAPRNTIVQNFQQRTQQHRAEYAKNRDIARLDRMVQWSSDDLGPHTDPPRPLGDARRRRLRAHPAPIAPLASGRSALSQHVGALDQAKRRSSPEDRRRRRDGRSLELTRYGSHPS